MGLGQRKLSGVVALATTDGKSTPSGGEEGDTMVINGRWVDEEDAEEAEKGRISDRRRTLYSKSGEQQQQQQQRAAARAATHAAGTGGV